MVAAWPLQRHSGIISVLQQLTLLQRASISGQENTLPVPAERAEHVG